MLGYGKQRFVHITLQQDYTLWQVLWKHALRMDLIEGHHPIIQKLWWFFYSHKNRIENRW